MSAKKCKNSVFCGLFLISVLLGTICAALLFQCICSRNYAWLLRYCESLRFSSLSVRKFLLAVLQPMVFLLLFLFLPVSLRAVYILVFMRSFLFSFAVCAALLGGSGIFVMILRNFVVMSLWLYSGLHIICRNSDRSNNSSIF